MREDFDRLEELRAPDTLFAGVVVAVSVRSGIRDTAVTRRRDDPNGLRNGWLRVGEQGEQY